MTDKKYKLRYLPLFYEDLEQKVVYISEKLQNEKAANDLIDAVETNHSMVLRRKAEDFSNSENGTCNHVFCHKSYLFPARKYANIELGKSSNPAQSAHSKQRGNE